jgi:hypothetical protein
VETYAAELSGIRDAIDARKSKGDVRVNTKCATVRNWSGRLHLNR